MIKIVGKPTAGSYYVGRPSILGNPFFMRTESERDLVCDQYKEWFKDQIKKRNPDVIQELLALHKIHMTTGELTLRCFCHPKRCHAETIKKFLEFLQRRCA